MMWRAVGRSRAVSLFDFESATRAGFPALDERGREATPIVGQIKITPKIWPVYHPQQATRVNFNQAITSSATTYHLTGQR